MKWAILVFVIIGIIFFIVIITRLTIYLDYRHSQDDDFLKVKVMAWFGLIHFTYIVPMVKIDKESGTPGMVVKKEMKVGQQENSLNKEKRKITPEDIITRIKNFKKLLEHITKFHKIMQKFMQKISILQFEWHSGIGTGDASHTGFLIGLAWTLKGAVLGLLSSHLKLKCVPDFSIHPYFQQSASETHLKCMIRFRIGNAMLAGIRLLKYWKGGLPHFKSGSKESVSKG